MKIKDSLSGRNVIYWNYYPWINIGSYFCRDGKVWKVEDLIFKNED